MLSTLAIANYRSLRELIAALEREDGSHSILLEKELGATRIAEADPLDRPPWKWPGR